MEIEEENPILVEAMAALQKRIHDLEEANGLFRRESALLRLQLNSMTHEQTDTEEKMLYEADDTLMMLESASEALKDLRRLKRENRLLRSAKDDLNQQLGKVLRQNSEIKAKVTAIKAKTSELESLQKEYDAMIIDVLTPKIDIQPSKCVKLDIDFMHNLGARQTHSMPAKLQTLLQELKTLPSDFSAQRIGTKQQIVAALSTGKSMIESMLFEIEQMRMEGSTPNAQKRLQPKIETKMNHIAVLNKTMERFRTVPV